MRRREGFKKFILKAEGKERDMSEMVKYPLPKFWIPASTFMHHYERMLSTQDLNWLTQAFGWCDSHKGYTFWSNVVCRQLEPDEALEILASWYLQLKEFGYEAASRV